MSNPNDLVKIKNENGDEVEVVRSSYDKVWADRGWTLVDDESSEGSQPGTAQQPDTSGTGNTQNEE